MKKRLLVIVILILCSVVSSAERTEHEKALVNIKEMINYINEHYYEDVKEDELIKGAYNGIFDVLDKHSGYIDKKTYEGVLKQLHGDYVGVGIVVEESKKGILITNIYGDSPAESSGLEINDVILTINGLRVNEVGYEKALDLLLGDVSTEVLVEVYKYKTKSVVNYKLVRQIIDLKSVIYEIKEDNIGYIRIVEFASNTSEKMTEALVFFEAQGITNVVLDLRDNPGGLLEEAIEILDMFIEKNQVLLRIKSKKGYESIYAKEDPLQLELVVLINDGSASASEIVAGILKYYDKAKLIGNTSYGKGTVQELLSLGQEAFKVTVSEFLLPNDGKINGVGIAPHLFVDNYRDLDIESIGRFAPMVENKNSSIGDVGLNIFGMEQRLQELEYEINLDGVFDRLSQKALIDYQIKHKLAGSGVLDGETINSLNQYFELAELDLNKDYQLEKALEILK